MRPLRYRSGLERIVTDGFAWPLGVDPSTLPTPYVGYACTFAAGDDEVPDLYTYTICVSSEHLVGVFEDAISLLPDEPVDAIAEVFSFDAYRMVDVHLSIEPITRRHFMETVLHNRTFFYEDARIGIGLQSQEPFIEVFMDEIKWITISVAPSLRDDVEDLLKRHGLEEHLELWPDEQGDVEWGIRSVVEEERDDDASIDDILFDLRFLWNLQLNVEYDRNLDDSGRDLGHTLWRLTAFAESRREPGRGVPIECWLTASSYDEAERMAFGAVRERLDLEAVEVYTIDRVAFDDRPEALTDLAPRRNVSQVHQCLADLGDGFSVREDR